MTDLTRGSFVDLLAEVFGCRTDTDLKKRLGIVVANWRKENEKDKPLSRAIVGNALRAGLRHKVHSAIEPLVEFHPLDFENGDTFATRINNKAIKHKLEDNCGIYIFFDSGGRSIYVGKTETNLFIEMQSRYNSKKINIRVLKNGKAARDSFSLKHVAYYFSSYKVDRVLVKNAEALLTRILINDANSSNIRVEGFSRRA
jgi:hypothetical protein